MTNQDDIAALTKEAIAVASEAVASAVQGLVQQAFRAGQASERQRVLTALGMADAAPAMITTPSAPKSVDTGRRAPRGLTKEGVMFVLGKHPGGLPIEEVQQLVVAYDARIAEKTVYNELMRGRTEEYRLREGRWYLAAHAPSVREPAETDDGVVKLFGGSLAPHKPDEEAV